MNNAVKIKSSDNHFEFLSSVDELSDSVEEFKNRYKAQYALAVYNPLVYARKPFEVYLSSYLRSSVKVILLGMNPGPFGMAQTGVPFGDISMVRDWMGIEEEVLKPEGEHPKRLITGFNCKRSEVSGSRLWGWARDRYNEPSNFFKNYFVWNYCPLVFMEESGANKTPDKLQKDEQEELFKICNKALRSLVSIYKPNYVIGVGKFAFNRANSAVGDLVKIDDILHPSPASPKANKNWKGEVETKLKSIACLY